MILARKKALLIDKDPIGISFYNQTLELLGFDTVIIDSIEKIHEQYKEQPNPNLIIMDLNQFNILEIDFFNQFDEIDAHAKTPVIVTNSKINAIDIHRKFDAANVDCIPKPLDQINFIKKINKIMNWNTQRLLPKRNPGIILESVKTTAVIIQKMFDILGVKSIVCSNIADFEKYMQVLKPEVVTLDLTLEDGQAIDVCKNIRNSKKLDELPIVLISAGNDKDAIIECLRTGVNDHLSKPIVKEEFFARLSNILKVSMLQKNLQEKQEELKNLAFTDGLTKLFNRAYMEMALNREFERSRRSGQPLGFILMDLDFFKNVNDTHGHEIGDDVLTDLGQIVKKCIRSYDIACRYGGEEFCVLLPGSTSTNVVIVAERIRKACQEHQFSSKKLKQTISIGTSVFPETSTIENLIGDADKALYSAKQGGRNRTITSLPSSNN